MAEFRIHLSLPFLILLLFFCFFTCLSSAAFSPSDNFLINCGSSTDATFSNRVYIPDANSNSFKLSAAGSRSIRDQSPSPDSSPLYQTARLFTRTSTYEFQITDNGTHMVRFHFFPFSSQEFNLNSAVFDVAASGSSLLSNFSPKNSTVREFFLRVDRIRLEISFAPSSTSSFAFVNAIEVISAPADLIVEGARLVNSDGWRDYSGLLDEVLETVHRINVGGSIITPSRDTLWRTWIPDYDFLPLKSSAKMVNYSGSIKYQEGEASREIAPDGVYNTAQVMNKSSSSLNPNFNITWVFPVNRGFKYLVRMHFCDIVSTALHQLYFDVFINSYSAYKDLDLSALTAQLLASPYYHDFVVDSDESGVIRVSVGPSDMSTPSRKNAILNGLEIMKINGARSAMHTQKKKKKKKNFGVLVGAVLGGFAFLCFLVAGLLLVFKVKRRKQSKQKQKTRDSMVWSPVPADGVSSYSKWTERTGASPARNINPSLKISFVDIQVATNNFDTNSLIGSGGFGNVYKGVLKDGTKVAVKRGMPGSRQGLGEFMTEITVLSKIRHRHLVSLIGYCEDQSEMILVYEFMENGTLKNHLYGSNLNCLSWKQRLEICIGAARGLHYLHTGSSQGIIHRDVKSANILLDENYLAKVADFGLSKAVPGLEQSHVSTNVKGSFGYLDPEYFRRQHLTDKSDVYSFGVVLFEILCARPALDPSLPREQVSLAEWAMFCEKKGLLEQIIDPKLVGQMNVNSLRKFGETAEKCLAEYGVDRPTMADVLWNLEYTLQLQETAMHREPHEDSTTDASESSLPTVQHASSTTRIEDYSLIVKSDASSDLSTNQVFSQLITNEGR